jgi:hypothetical protein
MERLSGGIVGIADREEFSTEIFIPFNTRK